MWQYQFEDYLAKLQGGWTDIDVIIVSASSLDKQVRGLIKGGGNVAASKIVGKTIAERARAKGIEQVVFDRGGYQYHGRVRALAEAAREAGLKF